MNAPAMNVYALMDDSTLHLAIEDLERRVSNLQFARGVVGAMVKSGYQDALDAARAEVERRRT